MSEDTVESPSPVDETPTVIYEVPPEPDHTSVLITPVRPAPSMPEPADPPPAAEPIGETPVIRIEEIEAALAAQFPQPDPVEPFPGDDSATWVYWGPMDTADGIPDEWVWERLRVRRNTLITECDWRVAADAPWDTKPWVTYRQALRDLPSKTTNPRKAVWPECPKE